MTIRINALSDADVAVLQELVQAHRARKRGDNKPTQQVVLPQAQEVFVAFLPSGGIPGRIGLRVFYANCPIYRQLNGILEPVAFDKKVYNLSTDDLPTGMAVLTIKDKYGTWWASDVPDSGEGGLTGTGTGSAIALYWWCLAPAGDTGTGTFGGDTGTGTGFDNASCHQLTVTEKEALLAQGWIQHAGPFATRAACTAACTAIPPVSVPDCCGAFLVPGVLNLTVANATGNCTCLEGSYLLQYNSSLQQWRLESTSVPCSGGGDNLLVVAVYCLTSLWILNFRCGDTFANFVGSADTVSCSPLQLTWAGISLALDGGLECCDSTETFDVIVTE